MAHGGTRAGAGRKSKEKHLSPRVIDQMRAKIKSSAIIRRLSACAVGEIEMTAPQVHAARILLGKILPDLSSVTVSGDSESPLVTLIVREIVRPPHKDG